MTDKGIKKIIVSALFICLFFFRHADAIENGGADMKLKSPAFEDNQYMPVKFSCEGKQVNPELVIEDIPQGAKGLALIMDDPDAPRGTWIHWVVFNIPPVSRIEEDSVPGKLGTNDSNPDGSYGAPCPPSGTHRYFFKIYALDSELDLIGGASKAELEKAMQGHILDKAQLIGLYKRKGR